MTIFHDRISLLARDLFDSVKYFHDKYFLTYNSLRTLELLLDYNDILLMKINFKLEKLSGRLEIDDLGVTIAVNDNHIPSRQLFTIAHELGHYYLHKDQKQSFLETNLNENLYSYGELLMEREANLFASELLVPVEVLEYMINHRYSFFRIYKTIGLSAEALKWRLHRYVKVKYETNYKFALMIVEDFKLKSELRRHEDAFLFYMDNCKFLQREIYEAICGRESFVENYITPKKGVLI